MARVVKLQPWGNQLPATLTVILSHPGGRQTGADGWAPDSPLSFCQVCLIREIFLGHTCSKASAPQKRNKGCHKWHWRHSLVPLGCVMALPCWQLHQRCHSSPGFCELNEVWKLHRALQNTFNPAVLLLIRSETAPALCLELGWGKLVLWAGGARWTHLEDRGPLAQWAGC